MWREWAVTVAADGTLSDQEIENDLEEVIEGPDFAQHGWEVLADSPTLKIVLYNYSDDSWRLIIQKKEM